LKILWFAFSLFFICTSSCKSSSRIEHASAFDGSRAFAQIETMVAFGPRVPGSAAHKACADYLLDFLSGYADTTWSDRWRHVTVSGDTLPLVNIRAAFNPAAGRRVLLCAHWDTRPVAECDPDPSKRRLPIPGANDGASGVAVLLELARVFSAVRPEIGVDIVLFDGEDYGNFYQDQDVLLGSRRFAARNPDYRPVLGILLDMVGDTNAAFYYEANSWSVLSSDCRMIWNTAEKLGYGRYFLKQIGPSVVDDHIPLLKAGIRCIDIVQMGLPYWHTHQDTPEKCSPLTLEAVGRTLADVLYALSGK